jgi:gluconolactonase
MKYAALLLTLVCAHAVFAQADLPPGAELIAEGLEFPEGPLVDGEGNLYFSDVRDAKILQYDGESVSTFAENTGGANGLALHTDGTIYACQGAGRAIAKFAPDRSMTTVLDSVGGKPLNATNDIVIDFNGNIFFTNPARGDATSSVVRIRPNGSAAVVATDQKYPNGIATSPDGKTLYVNDLMNGSRIWKYALSEDGEISDGEILVEFGSGFTDGMAVAASGNIYCALHAANKIMVVSPAGEILREINFPKQSGVTNMCFGGPDFKTLYVTLGAAGKVYAIPNDEPGMKMFSHR